jgi:hypothetical protein
MGCADHGVNLAVEKHLAELLAGTRGHHVARRHVRRHVLIAREHPRHPVQVEPVLSRHDRAGPHAGSHRVTAVDPDPAAGELSRLCDHSVAADQDRAMVESAHEEHRKRREPDAVFTCGEVGRKSHLGDVVRQFAHHAAKAIHEHGHLLEREREACWNDGTLFEGAVIALCASDSGQVLCHGISVRSRR